MGLNVKREPLGTFTRQDAPDYRDLIRGVFLMKLACRLHATVTVAGGAASGTLLREHVLRLLELRVVWDNVEIVPRTPAYYWFALTKRGSRQAPRLAELANADAQVTTTVEAYFEIPFARPWNINPFDTVLPPLPVAQQFRLEVYWATAANAGAGSGNGTGAMIAGGDRAVTFPTPPSLRVTQVYAPTGSLPLYLPVYSYFVSRQFTAASARFEHDIKSSRRFDAILVRNGSNAEERIQDGINSFSLTSANEIHINNNDYPQYHYDECTQYPGVSNTSNDDLGYLFYRFADGGKLTNAVDPRTIQQLQWQFDVDAPTTNPGVMRFLHSELLTWPGLTRVQE